MSDSLLTPWSHQAPLSMEFPRQGYWSGLPCPSPRDLPYPGIEPGSPTSQADSLPAEPPGKTIFGRGVLSKKKLRFSYNTSLVAQTVNCLSTMREIQVRSLGREDTLEKEMAPHSSTLAWKIPWTEEPDRLQSMGSLGIGHD